jgi:hypothetical protein
MKKTSVKNLILDLFIWLPISLAGLYFLNACTPKVQLHTTRWSGQGERPLVSEKIDNLQPSSSWKSLQEEVQISEQSIEGIALEGTYLKTVRRENQGIVFQSSALVPKIADRWIGQARVLNEHSAELWDLALKNNPVYRAWKVETPPHAIFSKSLGFKPVLRTLLSSNHGEILAVDFNGSGHVVSVFPMGSSLTSTTEVQALAFPRGPKRSTLSKVNLLRFNQPEGLANPYIEVITQSPLKITSDYDLDSPPPDDRFDQVQAYYFANQILNWFKNTLSLDGPFKLSIVTHVGYPDKTNTAFYFKDQIRLGAGDDITYSKIPWDPSIVMHETSHAVIDALARLPFQGQGGSLNEGFADFFTTFYLQSPLLGDSSYKNGDFKRTVDLSLKLSEVNGGLYHDSALVSGFFWNLKKLIGNDKALQLGVRVLHRLGPNSDFRDFALSLTEQVHEFLKDEDLNKTLSLMKDRELL